MRITLSLLFASALLAQTNTATVTATAPTGGRGGSSRSLTITLRPRTTLAALTCDSTEMEPGDTTTCHVALNQASRSSLAVLLTIPAGFSASPASPLIPAGATSVDFALTRNEVDPSAPVARLPLMPAGATIWGRGIRLAYAAEIMVPCCARSDRCGLPASQVSIAPCGFP